MSTILEKIADIEAEMARTQKNKATAGHLGMLKAKLAKLRRELITPKSQGGASEQGFEVAKVSLKSPSFFTMIKLSISSISTYHKALHLMPFC